MSGERGGRLLKELTLVVDVVDNKKVSANSIIEEAEVLCGEGNVLAVVPRSGNLYEINVTNSDAADELSTGPFVIGTKRYNCQAIYSKDRVVSFMHLPVFISDDVIRNKLEAYNVEIKSPIKQHMYDGTSVTDGTRYVVVKFPPNISSLPYTMKCKCESSDNFTASENTENNDEKKDKETKPKQRDTNENEQNDESEQPLLKKSRIENDTPISETLEKSEPVIDNLNADTVITVEVHNNADTVINVDEHNNDESNGEDLNLTVTEMCEAENKVNQKPCETTTTEVADEAVDDELDLLIDNDNVVNSFDNNVPSPGGISEKGGTDVVCGNESVDMEHEECTMTSDPDVSIDKLNSENESLVEMTDEEMANDLVKYGGRVRHTNRQGVAFLVSPKYKNYVTEIKGFDGRFIYIQLEVDNKIIDIVNVYCPNVVNEKDLFLKKVNDNIPKSDDLILLGDFNQSLSPLDRVGKHFEDKAFKSLNNLLDSFNIYDVWRATSRIDNLKYRIKRETQVYARDKKCREKAEYFKIQNKFEKISNLAANNLKYDTNEYEEIKSKMKDFEDKICKGAILRSKAYWAVEGDKNSKYFLQLEKYRQENNAIKELENDQGKLLTKSNDVLDEIQDYYKNLYSCTNIDESKMKEISNFLTNKVSEDDVNFCDSDIKLEEIFKSLHEMNKNKSPGSDGLTVSFYSAEPLVQAILKNKNIKGIAIPNSDKNSTVFAHADDFTFTVKDKQSIDETFKVLNNYSEASGAKINKQKSEIMCLGSGSISNQELTDYGIKQADEVTQILGIYMGKNSEICDYLNWDSKIKKAKTILYFWSKRELTLHGRATVLTSLIMSRFYYTLTVCPIPEKYKNEIKAIILKFLWQNNSHLVKYKTVVAAKIEGGLNIPEIHLRMQAFRLKFFSKFLDSNCQALWKSTMKYFINKIENMKIAENIAYACFNLNQIKILPKFYQEMIQAYYAIKSKVDFNIHVQHIYENPLFCNPVINVKGKALLYREFINSGIIKIKDICYEFIPVFLSKDSIIEIVQEKYPELRSWVIINAYRRILNAIPQLWKNELTAINPVNVDRFPCLTVGTNMTEFSKATTKIFYKLLLQSFSEPPTSEMFWLKHFPSMCFHALYRVVNQCHIPPECISLNYRVATNTIFTLDKLQRINKVDSNMCLSCKSCPEDMFHLWSSCPFQIDFKRYLIDIIHNVLLKDTQHPIMDYDQLILHGYLVNTKSS
ncbi:unnamed protein product [Mytilus coruscus]|uniref:Reverse transcriptase domain-containing protein n=1 Tax=Mytilus coruscus TaxID=42192 RepID=A0A6J8EVC7_MYTCO|nr:unnamed protein product [Mytilus coruscus]